MAALAGVGITTAFPIQAMTLPVALSGHDIIGQAKTGTGKTLGFGIPVLEQVVGPGEEGWDALAAPSYARLSMRSARAMATRFRSRPRSMAVWG